MAEKSATKKKAALTGTKTVGNTIDAINRKETEI
jgi:hypothetical protein